MGGSRVADGINQDQPYIKLKWRWCLSLFFFFLTWKTSHVCDMFLFHCFHSPNQFWSLKSNGAETFKAANVLPIGQTKFQQCPGEFCPNHIIIHDGAWSYGSCLFWLWLGENISWPERIMLQEQNHSLYSVYIFFSLNAFCKHWKLKVNTPKVEQKKNCCLIQTSSWSWRSN